jgi:hypothetical protein
MLDEVGYNENLVKYSVIYQAPSSRGKPSKPRIAASLSNLRISSGSNNRSKQG